MSRSSTSAKPIVAVLGLAATVVLGARALAVRARHRYEELATHGRDVLDERELGTLAGTAPAGGTVPDGTVDVAGTVDVEATTGVGGRQPAVLPPTGPLDGIVPAVLPAPEPEPAPAFVPPGLAEPVQVPAEVELEAEARAPGEELSPADLPLADFDHLTLPQLRGRLRSLDLADLVRLRDYEQAHAARLPVLTLLDNRLAKLVGEGGAG